MFFIWRICHRNTQEEQKLISYQLWSQDLHLLGSESVSSECPGAMNYFVCFRLVVLLILSLKRHEQPFQANQEGKSRLDHTRFLRIISMCWHVRYEYFIVTIICEVWLNVKIQGSTGQFPPKIFLVYIYYTPQHLW